MKYVLILVGAILTGNALLYFVSLYELISDSNEFTKYGLGILAGKTIFLLMGIFFMYRGINKLKKSK